MIDGALILQWIVSGLVGLTFGVVGAWVTYRLNRKRDDLNWQREQRELLKQQLRKELLKGVDNPVEAIWTLRKARDALRWQREEKERASMYSRTRAAELAEMFELQEELQVLSILESALIKIVYESGGTREAIERICPACGYANPPESQICSKCGRFFTLKKGL